MIKFRFLFYLLFLQKLSDFLNENNDNNKIYEEAFKILYRDVISMKNDHRFSKKPFKGKDVRELYTQWIKSFKLLYFLYESNEKIRKYFNRSEVIHEIIDIILFVKKRKELNKTVIESNYTTKLFKKLLKYMSIWKEEFKNSKHIKLGVDYLNDNGIKLPKIEIPQMDISSIIERGNNILNAAKTVVDEGQIIMNIINCSIEDENKVDNDILNEEDEEFEDIEFVDVDDNESTLEDPDIHATLEENIIAIKQIINRIDDFISTIIVNDTNLNMIKESLLQNKSKLNIFMEKFKSISNDIEQEENKTSNENLSIEIELGHSTEKETKSVNSSNKSNNKTSSSKKRPRKSGNLKNALLQNLKLINARRKKRKPVI